NGTQAFTGSQPLPVMDEAVQPDGKILVAGDGNLTRLNPNGSLDASFGSGGVVSGIVIGMDAAAVEGDGKILVAGGSSLARYNADGSIDRTFGGKNTGQVFVGLPTMVIRSIAVQSDGKIVVAGDAFDVVRFNPDGSVDFTFGSPQGGLPGLPPTF